MVVLGSNSALLNEGLVRSYPWVGNLLSYLAHDHAGPESPWRQAMCLSSCLAILFLLRRPTPRQLISIGIVLYVGFAAALAWSGHAARVIPDAARTTKSVTSESSRTIAYIDQSHLEAYSFEDWGFDAINGLSLNLMRNGCIPLMLPEVTAERLNGASLFISIAPAKEFTVTERTAIKSFVERGGVFICTVGAEQSAASAPLLSDFGLRVPESPVPTDGGWPEPEPFGRGKAFYLNVKPADNEAYQVAMQLRAAWPVESTDGQASVIAFGHNQLRMVASDTELPVVLERRFGRGAVVLIGDTGFAMNKNLEYIGGEPFAGDYENAHFWRWLIARVTRQLEWIPPRRVEQGTTAAATEEGS